MKSWKIGAVSGLIAGIIAGLIAAFITTPLIFRLGLTYYLLSPPPETPLTKIFTTEIILMGIWGVFLGIIYSKIQDLIPGRGVLKGLIFGLALYLILNIRGAIFLTAYGLLDMALGSLMGLSTIIYGLMLGILYKAPKEKLVTKKHEIMSGVIPGVFTGLIFGIAVTIKFILSAYFGTIFGFMETYPDYLKDVGFIISQLGAHTVINMFLMGIFGAFYAMFYDRIPGKGIIKGSIFGLIIWAIIDLLGALYWLVYGYLGWALFAGLVSLDIYVFFGLVLEGLYKRRPRAFLVAGAVFVIVIIRTIMSSLG